MQFNTHVVYQDNLFQAWINYYDGQWTTSDDSFSTTDWDELQEYLKDKQAVVFTEMVRQHWLPVHLADCWAAHQEAGAIASLPSLEALRATYIEPEERLQVHHDALLTAIKEPMPEEEIKQCFADLMAVAADSLAAFCATVSTPS